MELSAGLAEGFKAGNNMCLGRLTSETHVVNCFPAMSFKVFCKEKWWLLFYMMGSWGREKWLFPVQMIVHVGARSTIEPPDSLMLQLLALLLFWFAPAQPVNSLLYLHFTFAWLISFKAIKIFPTGKAQRTIITAFFNLQGWTYFRGVLSLYWNLNWSDCLCECILEE